MIAGRLHWRPPQAKLAGRNALAAFDFPVGSLVLTEAGSKRRASLHVVRGQEALQALDPGGVEVFSTTLDGFRAALTAENRTLKRALTDPRLISGVGNAYSDEILHAAHLSPFARGDRLDDAALGRLLAALRETLGSALEQARGLDIDGLKEMCIRDRGRGHRDDGSGAGRPADPVSVDGETIS